MADASEIADPGRVKLIDCAGELIKLTESIRSLERISSAQDVQRIHETVSKALNYLPGPATPEKWSRMDCAVYIDWKSIANNEYAAILEEVIRLFDDTWPMAASAIDSKISQLFSIDHSTDFVEISIATVLSKTNASKFHILVPIFEQCLRTDTWLMSAFVDSSYCRSYSDSERHNELIQWLVSTPNRVANHFEGKVPETFVDETYCSILSLAFIRALHFTMETNAFERNEIFTAKFLAGLFSRLTIDFNANRTSKVLPKVIAIQANWSTNEKYRPMIQQLILHLNPNAMEHVALYILETDQTDQLLGDAVSSSEGWAHVLKSKLPMMTHSKDNRIIKNLIEYLASHLSGVEHNNTITDFVRCWASRNYIANQTLDEHIHLTKLIVLGVHRFRVKESVDLSNEIKRSIQKGVQYHMECLQSTARAIGMVTAEIVMNYLCDPNAKVEDELHFDYDSFTATEKVLIAELLAFPHWSSEPQEIDTDSVIDEIIAMSAPVEHKVSMAIGHYSVPTQTTEVEASLTAVPAGAVALTQPKECDEMDSDDDDLQPYDLSNDTAQAENKAPRYLIDLRDALQDTDDPDVFEQCMITSAALIAEKLPNDISDMGIELLQRFIKLDQRFYMENFEQHRFAVCLAIGCVQPKESAEFLCKEFHSDVGRYSIAQKILMLDVLGETARELSKLSTANKAKASVAATKPSGKLLEIKRSNDTLAEARRVIGERIQRKTRRFAHRTVAAYQNEQVNKFAPVAGDFFFPLVYGLGKQPSSLSRHWLKNDTDNILLYSLLNTIATITLAAQNCPILPRIAPGVFELSTVLRFHSEAKIREGVLQMIAAALMVTPTHILQMHCAAHLNELRLWLDQCLSSNIIRGGEKDAECRELAQHVLAMCVNALSQ